MSIFRRITPYLILLCLLPHITFASNRLFTSSSTIEVFIRGMARIYGVPEETALYIAQNESKLNPYAIGDHGKSRGIWQIHKGFNPNVSDREAFSVVSSTIWAMEQMADGNYDLWSVWRFRPWIMAKW